MLGRFGITQYSIHLYVSGDSPSFKDQTREWGNFVPTIEVLLMMIMYILQVQLMLRDVFGNKSRRINATALPKAEYRLFSFIKM